MFGTLQSHVIGYEATVQNYDGATAIYGWRQLIELHEATVTPLHIAHIVRYPVPDNQLHASCTNRVKTSPGLVYRAC